MALNILVLCTGNSARSIMAEALINERGEGRIKAYSAGSKPVGKVNPVGLKLLESKGYDTSDFRSKSWDEFAAADAPQMDAVITVCSNAAGETCPVWPGAPVTAHWGFPDPADAGETEEERLAAFSDVYDAIDRLVLQLACLPDMALEGGALKENLQFIAETHEASLAGAAA